MKNYIGATLCVFLLTLTLVVQAQDEPAPTQSVADAVSTLIAQTQQAPNMTQTVQRALEEALRGTAQAGTPQAATPAPAPTSVPIDVDSLEVVGTTEFDLMAGPGNTAAYLAPDGERFVYLADERLCLYAQDAPEPHCVDLDDTLNGLDPLDPETIVWSPDSRYIAFSENFFIYLIDADIWVWDTTTSAVQNLTDDGVTRLEIGGDDWKNIDVTPTWLEDGRILFLRYNSVDEETVLPEIKVIASDGSGLEQLGTLEDATGFAAYALDAHANQLAYNFYRGGEPENGVWTSAFDGSDSQQVFVDDGRHQPANVIFSPNGRYLLVNTPPRDFRGFDPEDSNMRLVDLESGEPLLIDPERFVTAAAWSPDGSAFAYLVTDRVNEEISGLYVTDTPGEAGRLVLQGVFLSATPRLRQPLTWGANNTILLARAPEPGIVLVELGS